MFYYVLVTDMTGRYSCLIKYKVKFCFILVDYSFDDFWHKTERISLPVKVYFLQGALHNLLIVPHAQKK